MVSRSPWGATSSYSLPDGLLDGLLQEVQQVLANVSHLSDIGIGRGQLPMLEALEKSVSNLLNKASAKR